MIDIVEVTDGEDLAMANTVVRKAANLLSVQLGDLEYSPDFGVDLKFFIESDFQFQNETFKAYLVERLTQNQINVAEVLEAVETLFAKYTFKVGNANNDAKGLIL